MSKTILIGREVDGTHLMALTLDNNCGKPTKTYIGDNVSTSVTRLRLVDNNRWIGHCKIDIANDGSMRISNIKAENITRVNGNGVASRAITWNDNITLGSGGYQLDMTKVRKLIQNINGGSGGKTLDNLATEAKSIKHLEYVWKQYDEDKHTLLKKNRSINLLKSSASIFTVPVIALSGFMSSKGIDGASFLWIISAIGAVITVYGWYQSYKFDISVETEELNERLKQNYCCPHCSLPLTAMGEYAMLSGKVNITKKCPHCGKPLTTE